LVWVHGPAADFFKACKHFDVLSSSLLATRVFIFLAENLCALTTCSSGSGGEWPKRGPNKHTQTHDASRSMQTRFIYYLFRSFLVSGALAKRLMAFFRWPKPRGECAKCKKRGGRIPHYRVQRGTRANFRFGQPNTSVRGQEKAIERY
jgi:hypothetical protein